MYRDCNPLSQLGGRDRTLCGACGEGKNPLSTQGSFLVCGSSMELITKSKTCHVL